MTSEATHYIEGIIWDQPINERLASLTGTCISVRGVTASVVPVNDAASISEVQSSLEEVEDDDWDWGGWLHRGIMSHGSPVIGVRDQSSGQIVGFCSIETSAFVSNTETGGVIDLSLEIASLYVRPDHRGRGFGTILRQAAATYLRSVIDDVAATPPEDIPDLELSGLSVTVDAHPESQGGHALANHISGEVEAHLSALAGKAWFGTAIFNDETDPEDAPSMT